MSKKQKKQQSAKPVEEQRARISEVQAKAASAKRPATMIRERLQQSLRAKPDALLEELTEDLSVWARQGHTAGGRRLWSDHKTFGVHYVALVLSRGIGAPMSEELRLQLRHVQLGTFVAGAALAGKAAQKEAAARRAEERAEKRRKAAEAKRLEAEEQRQAAETKHLEAEKQRQERERRSAHVRAEAVEEVRAFFTAAGVEFSVDGYLVSVGGRAVAFGVKAAKSPTKRAEWIDGVVARQFADRLVKMTVRHLDGLGPEVRAVPGRSGVVVGRAGTSLGVIRATHATPKHAERIKGNFLTSGNHWLELRNQLEAMVEAAAAEETERERAAAERFQHVVHSHAAFPGELDPERAAAALEASRALRTRRNLVFGHVVELEHGPETLHFEPVRLTGDHVEVPFRFHSLTEDIECWLRLTGRIDPLTLRVRGRPSEDVLGRCWTSALVGYSTLTCRDELTQLTVRPRIAGHRSAPNGVPRTSASRSPGHSGRTLDFGDLHPLGNTARWIASYVAGHRRRLRPGQHASPEAVERARRVGITLGPNDTWVSPHVRGVPPDAVLRFRWTPPPALRHDET